MAASMTSSIAGLSPARGLIALVFLSLAAFLPGFAALPVTDRDEARFAQAARQMVESGDPIDIRFGDEARLKKPAGIYWLQAGAALASGQGDRAPLWVHRLPSLIGASAAVVLVAVAGAPLVGWSAALWAGALMVVTLVLGAEARIAKTDAALLATVLAAQAVLMQLHMAGSVSKGRGMAYAFWLAVAAGVLLKGPIGPAVLALTATTLALLRREARWLRPLAAPGPIVLALAVALPWFVAITLRDGADFWQGSVGVDLLPKIAAGQEGKGAPPGSYLLALWLTFWPGSVLLVLALPGLWRERRTRPVQALLAWAVPFWMVLEAVPTKLVHYPLPVYPALALAAAAWGPAGLAMAGRGLRLAAALALLPGLLLGLGVLWFGFAHGSDLPALWPLVLGLAAATVLSGAAGLALARRQVARIVPLSVLAGLALYAGLFPGFARLEALWPGHRAVAAAQRHAEASGCTAAPDLVGWGYTEPSLIWLAGRDTRRIRANEALPDAVSAGARCTYIIRARRDGLPPPSANANCPLIGQFEGLAIGAGKWVTLDLLTCEVAR